MATEDGFAGAKEAFMFFEAFVNAVAQEIGMERTLGIMTKMSEDGGAMQGKMMKQQAGAKEIDAKEAWSLLKTAVGNLVLRFQLVEENPKRVVIKAGRCAVYEAGQALGLDGKTIETVCRAGGNRFDDTLVKQFNPRLSFRLRKFRSSADDFCEEEIVLG
jgi:L-2-amino-thiazoline-4-carboxylic acid hydrolase